MGVRDRSVCQRMECAAVDLCVLDSATTCADNQRLLSVLETPEVLRVSPVFPHSQMFGESSQGRGDFGPGMPLLAVPDLVSSSSRIGSGCSADNQTSSESVNVERAGGSSAQQFANSVRVENIRMRFRDRAFSEDVISLLLDANRASTISSYQSAWNHWFGWCTGRGSDPLCNSVAVVLQYLADMHKEGYASRSINVHRSMLSMTLDSVDGFKLGDHPLVVQLLKGCFNNNPPRPRYDSTWDPDIVFRYLTSLGDNSSLSLPQLSQKLVILLALATLMRVSELASISFQSLSFSELAAFFLFSVSGNRSILVHCSLFLFPFSLTVPAVL
jgi:hypothetical protein